MAESGSFWKRWWPFVLLCVAASTRWMFVEAWPQTASTAGSEAVACCVAGVLSLGLVTSRRRPPPTLRGLLYAGLAGAMFLCGQALALFVVDGAPRATDMTIALGLVPVVVAVTLAARTQGAGISAAALWPDLVAVAGLLQLLPQPDLLGPRNDALLLLAPLLTGAGCVLLPQAPMATRWKTGAALAGAGTVFAAGAGWMAFVQHSSLRVSVSAVALDLLAAWLTIVALGRIRPQQYSAIYALAPLMVMLQGLVIYRPQLTWRSALGIVLLLVGSVALLMLRRNGPEEEVTSLLPR